MYFSYISIVDDPKPIHKSIDKNDFYNGYFEGT